MEVTRLKKTLDEIHIRNLSFPDFDVEKMQFSPEKKTLKIYVEGAWLDEDEGGGELGNGVLFFSNWEFIEIKRFEYITKNWCQVEEVDPEFLKDICEFKFLNSSVALCGFGGKSGEWLEWKITNSKMYAEFEIPQANINKQGIIKVSLNEIQAMFNNLIEERMSREQVAQWASKRQLALGTKELEFEPSYEEGKIWSGITYLVGVDRKDMDGNYLRSIEDLINFRKKNRIKA